MRRIRCELYMPLDFYYCHLARQEICFRREDSIIIQKCHIEICNSMYKYISETWKLLIASIQLY